MDADFEHRYRAVRDKDARFDGWFVTAVTSTGIYCRPSCPARTPKPENVRFYPTAAAAERAGFRPCKRCRPNIPPGSPRWDVRQDLVGRAVALIGDGVVDREGVGGLARRLGFTERHLHRVLAASVGAGPLALARARRAHTARLLVEATDLPMTDVAFAAGFRSLRQFNESMRELFAHSPTDLRRTAAAARAAPARGIAARAAATRNLAARADADRNAPAGPLTIDVRLRYRAPCDIPAAIDFLAQRAVPGVEEVVAGVYHRSLRLAHGAAVISLAAGEDAATATLRLPDVRDLGAAVVRCRRLLDLDSDPAPILQTLGGDPLLGALVHQAPGRRVPGHVDADELAIRAVLGQQVSLRGAATLAARLVAAHGEPLERPHGAVTHLFPSPAALADADPQTLAMPHQRRAALLGLARAIAGGDVDLHRGTPTDELNRRLRTLPGIGPWTAGYIAMRALGDADAFLATDLGIRHALRLLGADGRPAAALRTAERWRPYRAYATQHLWAHLAAAGNARRAA